MRNYKPAKKKKTIVVLGDKFCDFIATLVANFFRLWSKHETKPKLIFSIQKLLFYS